MIKHEAWLRQAIDLAGQCPPSDTAFSVGAIIVDCHGRELARGYSREQDPKVHAEESAIAKLAGHPGLAGATIYCSLEPCGERASRPASCAQLIIEAGIGRVVAAWAEPDDFVREPCGYQILRAAGLDVVELPDIAAPNYRHAKTV